MVLNVGALVAYGFNKEKLWAERKWKKERSQKIISAKNLFNVSGKMGFLQKTPFVYIMSLDYVWKMCCGTVNAVKKTFLGE